MLIIGEFEQIENGLLRAKTSFLKTNFFLLKKNKGKKFTPTVTETGSV